MSETQITVTIALWIVAIIPLGTALVIFVLAKTGVLATPIEGRGLVPKVASMLAVGGCVGLLSMAGGAGAGFAVAGVWVGVLSMFNATLSFWEVAIMYWGHLLLIVLSAPAIAVIVATVTIFYYGWDLWDAELGQRTGKMLLINKQPRPFMSSRRPHRFWCCPATSVPTANPRLYLRVSSWLPQHRAFEGLFCEFLRLIHQRGVPVPASPARWQLASVRQQG